MLTAADVFDDDVRERLQRMKLDDPFTRGVLIGFLSAAFARHDLAVSEEWLNEQFSKFVAVYRDQWSAILQAVDDVLELQQRVLH